jgi:predicted DNA binding CopG/RHH family protein
MATRKNKSVSKNYILDKEEEKILNSFEAGEWKSVGLSKNIKDNYQKAATNSLTKNKRINIRLNQIDLESIQKKAFEEGLPYQTLISSLIHKFVTGRLVEK